MIKRPKIAIVGAGGNVGAAVAQWAVQKELGDLVLIDLKAQAAEGRALDLTQCGPWEGFNNTSFVASSDAAAMAGADVVVMTAGVPRKPGQSREELININAGIVRDICKSVKEHAPDAVLIVVSNPLDAMVFVAKQVTGFPRERVIGSAGVLDSARFRTYLAMAAGVSVEDVQAIVLGAHTDKDMVPILSTATIGNVPVGTFLSAEQLAKVVEDTKKGGATLTALMGTSAWLAPGAGTCLMVEAIVRNQGRVLPCSVELAGEFGVTGAFVGVPVKLSAKGAEAVFEFELSAAEKDAFAKSVAANVELMGIAKGFL
ncbi:MAG: malate dehydrogenase [Kofleriaceae bacterium]|jgi:malate dehydrogenase|nr:malate dehydrogenase [Kofleriaceae bacterium]MBP9171053.1 malate dehydrogenase [Kofleriaceae bacterium]MBP9862354.1 malate dehydrogenase [Kofleriaceae bacterium]